MSMSSARRSAMTSFSCVGTPYGVQLAPTMLSHAAPVTFWWVKVISMPFRLTPRSVSKCCRFTLAPTKTRPRPRVRARSPNTGPGEMDVRTGTPPWNRNVEPPLVALTGTLATLPLMAFPIKEMRVPFSARAAGTPRVRRWFPSKPEISGPGRWPTRARSGNHHFRVTPPRAPLGGARLVLAIALVAVCPPLACRADQAPAGTPGPPQPPPPPWRRVWHDEFDGTALDTTKWVRETGGNGWGNGELEFYTNRSENARDGNR